MLNEVIYGSGEDLVNFRILELNNSFENMFDISKENIIGKTIKEVYPEINSSWIDACARVALSGKGTHHNIYLKRLDKHFKANIISPTKGQFIVLFNDVTDIVKANEVLKKQSILFDNVKDIILYLKSDGSITDANKTAVKTYGYSYPELLDMKLQELRHPSTMKDFEYQMKISESEGIVFECIHIKKNGINFPVEVSSTTTGIDGELFRVHIIRDITQRKKSEEKIEYLANYDSLTNIPNRGFLMYQFNKMLEYAKRTNSKFAVMLFDIDKFKLTNDVHGHNAGDEVLKEVAKRLQEVVRKADMIGRLGGDEFLVIQPLIKDKDDALILANRILDYVAKPVKWNNVNLDVHISIGIAMYPEASDNVEGLIHYADDAMYSIKKKGGNAYNFYSEMNT